MQYASCSRVCESHDNHDAGDDNKEDERGNNINNNNIQLHSMLENFDYLRQQFEATRSIRIGDSSDVTSERDFVYSHDGFESNIETVHRNSVVNRDDPVMMSSLVPDFSTVFKDCDIVLNNYVPSCVVVDFRKNAVSTPSAILSTFSVSRSCVDVK
jgi:hypothetical protein